MPATGDIVLLPFPFSDLSSQKKRPALVLTPPDATGDFIALAITSRPTPFPAVALSNDDLLTGHLPKPSWIRTDKVFTFSLSLVVAHVATLKPTILQQALHALCDKVGLPANHVEEGMVLLARKGQKPLSDEETELAIGAMLKDADKATKP